MCLTISISVSNCFFASLYILVYLSSAALYIGWIAGPVAPPPGKPARRFISAEESLPAVSRGGNAPEAEVLLPRRCAADPGVGPVERAALEVINLVQSVVGVVFVLAD